MKMDGWQDHLHFSLLGEHVLFPGLRLESPSHFVVASFLTVLLCLFERWVWPVFFSRTCIVCLQTLLSLPTVEHSLMPSPKVGVRSDGRDGRV